MADDLSATVDAGEVVTCTFVNTVLVRPIPMSRGALGAIAVLLLLLGYAALRRRIR